MAERDELTTAYVREHFVNAMFTPGDASEVDYADASEINEEQARFDAWLESVRAEARRPRVIDTPDELEALPIGSVVLDSDDAPEGRTAWTVEEDETGRWWRNGELGLNANSLHLFGPVTVLWEGGES